jgi:S-adenosylhomocysteine hydrolase
METIPAYRVQDILLADEGQKKIQAIETGFSALHAFTQHYAPKNILSGLRITTSMDITPSLAILANTFLQLGAQVRCASREGSSTDHSVAAAMADSGVNIYCTPNGTDEELAEDVKHSLLFAKNVHPNIILDDGDDEHTLSITIKPEDGVNDSHGGDQCNMPHAEKMDQEPINHLLKILNMGIWANETMLSDDNPVSIIGTTVNTAYPLICHCGSVVMLKSETYDD